MWKAKHAKCFLLVEPSFSQETTADSLGRQTAPECPGITVRDWNSAEGNTKRRSKNSPGLLIIRTLALGLSPSFPIALGYLLRSKGIAPAAMRFKCAQSLPFTVITLPVIFPAPSFHLLQACTTRPIQHKHQSYFLSRILF